jgi:multiple sugar transport system permease protein
VREATALGSHVNRPSTAYRLLGYIRQAVLYVFLFALALLSLLPFVWMLSTSLKEPSSVFVYPPKLLPRPVVLQNYVDAWQAAPFGRFMVNSMVHSVLVTLLHLVTSGLAAYSFARLRFRGRDVLFMIYLGTMMIPSQVTLVPSYIIVRNLNWIDTYLGLIVPMGHSALGVFLLRQFFMTIPMELEDAARIDGCGPLRSFLSIILPLSKPALATLSLFSFMNTWNSFFWPLVVTNTTTMRTLQIGLRYFINAEGGNEWNLLMAASVITVAPVLVAFFFAQKQFIEGIALTGIKG